MGFDKVLSFLVKRPRFYLSLVDSRYKRKGFADTGYKNKV